MKDKLIKFKTAKLAKEKGFTLNTVGSHTYNYYKENGETGCISWGHLNLNSPACVPQSLLQRWLREVHKIHITITSVSQESWMYRITKPGQKLTEGAYGEDFYTYELALEDALYNALNLIK